MHISCQSGAPEEMASPSPPLGAERVGVRWGFRVIAVAHLTFPRLRRGPLPLPPEGRRGISYRPVEMCACPSAFAGATVTHRKHARHLRSAAQNSAREGEEHQARLIVQRASRGRSLTARTRI